MLVRRSKQRRFSLPRTINPYVFIDNFDGSGALADHIPDLSPDGSVYSIIAGTFSNLSGGYLTYASGTYGRAVINCGLSDFEMEFRLKHFNKTSQASSVLLRSNSAGTDYYEVGTWANLGVTYITCAVPGAVPYPPSNSVNTQIFAMTEGQYYTFRALLKGPFFRLLDENDTVLLASLQAAKTGQTYIGPRVQQAFGGWDYIKVKPFSRSLKYFGVIGDSISNEPNEWPGLVSVGYNGSMSQPNNYAASGSQVAYHLSGQATSVVGANPDFTFVAMGTNDGWPSAGFQNAYYNGLMVLQNGLPGKPIYALGVFPKSPDSDRAGKNAAIEAAVADAVSAGANAVYWNTDGWFDPATDTGDGLHPNSAGHIKIKNEVLARL